MNDMFTFSSRLLPVLSLLIIGPVSISGVVTADDQHHSTQQDHISDVIAKTKPAVVEIVVKGRDGEQAGIGSGVIIQPQGLIVTNLHVIGEGRSFEVTLSDGRKIDIESVVAFDRKLDLAILQPREPLDKGMTLGNSTSLRVGQTLIALGHPLGLKYTAAIGILSGIHEIEGRKLLQLAMPIDRGHSGGPVLDLEGNVVGIIALKSAERDDVGFAIPIEDVQRILEQSQPIEIQRWLTLGALDPALWLVVTGGNWRQRRGHLIADGPGPGLGARCLCLSREIATTQPYEVSVRVKLTPWDGAAGLAFCADGKDRHYGFYISRGVLRLSRFEGPDVYAWSVLKEVPSSNLRQNDWNHLRVRVEPNQIVCWVNDELLLSLEDKTFRSGMAGVCKFRHTKAEFREFRIAAELPSGDLRQEQVEELIRWMPALNHNNDIWKVHVPESAISQTQTYEALLKRAHELELQASRVRLLAQRVHHEHIKLAFRQVVDAPLNAERLLRASLLISQADHPDLDSHVFNVQYDKLLDRIRASMPPEAGMQERWQTLNDIFFRIYGFRGARQEYHHRSNSYVNEVLENREGIPLTLCILFLSLAEQLDLPVQGVGLPGHFVVRYSPPEAPPQLIDVYEGGKIITPEDAQQKVRDLTELDWDDTFLNSTAPADILIRMLRNLLRSAQQADDYESMWRYVDLLLILTPDVPTDRLQRAVLSYQLERYPQALEDIAWLEMLKDNDVPKRMIEELRRAVESRYQEMPTHDMDN